MDLSSSFKKCLQDERGSFSQPTSEGSKKKRVFRLRQKLFMCIQRCPAKRSSWFNMQMLALRKSCRSTICIPNMSSSCRRKMQFGYKHKSRLILRCVEFGLRKRKDGKMSAMLSNHLLHNICISSAKNMQIPFTCS